VELVRRYLFLIVSVIFYISFFLFLPGLGSFISGIPFFNQTQYLSAIQEASFKNTTQLALQQTSNPYFVEALFQLFGIAVHPENKLKRIQIPRPGVQRSFELLFKFLSKLSTFYYLPASASIQFFQELIYCLFIIWFTLNLLSFLLWILMPDLFKKKISSPMYNVK
jgi:hypothetical protein